MIGKIVIGSEDIHENVKNRRSQEAGKYEAIGVTLLEMVVYCNDGGK